VFRPPISFRAEDHAWESRFLSETHLLDPLLRRWSKRCNLSAGDREAVKALPFTRKTFGKDAYLVREGQEATDCQLILRGFAYRQKILPDGDRQIISFHIPTEFVDLQNSLLGLADHNVQGLNLCEVAIFPIAALTELANSAPGIRLAMWIDTLIDSSIFREWVVNVGRRNSRARIAHLLCELAFRLTQTCGERDGAFDFPITQEQLADATGLTAVHTNRTLQSLRRDGLIKLSSGILKVLDWEALREAGDFDELYLHHKV
jgi:CRP-like cAMP-binding protein